MKPVCYDSASGPGAGVVVDEQVLEGIGVLRNTIAPKVNPDSNYRFKAPPRGAPAR